MTRAVPMRLPSTALQAPDTLPTSAAARLLVACTAPATPDLGALDGVDWTEFAMLTRRHAAAPLVHRALATLPGAEVPVALRDALRRHALVNRLRNEWLVEELRRIITAAGADGVDLVPYKGPVLAQQLYGDVGLRVCSDLDLLSAPAGFERAGGVMRALGYRFVPLRGQRAERGAAANLGRWHCYNFRREQPRTAVDLHVRFAPAHFPVAADLSTFADRLVWLEIDGHAFAGFADDDLLVLLAMHAAKDLMWRRLTWFSDLAVLAHRLPPAALSRAMATAGTIGCRRLLLLALLLVQRLYGLPAGTEWPGTARERTGLQPLATSTMQRLFAPTPAEPSRLQVHFVAHPALRERRRDRWASYAAGLRSLPDLLRPPTTDPAMPAAARLLDGIAHGMRAAGRRLRRIGRIALRRLPVKGRS